MNLADQNVLLFSRSSEYGGTEKVMLQICEVLRPNVNKIVICGASGFNSNMLKDLGIKYYNIGDIESRSPFHLIATSIRLIDIINKEEITIIHTHHRMAAFYIATLHLHLNRIFINTSHNTFTDKKFFTRFAYKKANLISCGNMVKRNLVEFYGIDQERVTVIPNSIKANNQQLTIDPDIQRWHSQGVAVIGNIGRLAKQKGMEYYIRAIPNVLCKHRHTKFLIVGAGEDENELKLLADKLKIRENVIFTGYRSDIQNLMAQLDFIVLSSLWEGFPLTPIEAFSVGKTIVATAVSGTVEIVKDGRNGLLAKPGDAKDLADKINELLSDIDKRKMYEVEAKKDYENEFSFEVFGNKYLNCYQSLLDQKITKQ